MTHSTPKPIAHAVPAHVSKGSTSAIQSLDDWRRACAAAANDPDGFWLNEARTRLTWRREPTVGCVGDFFTVKQGPLTWFEDGLLNLTETCVDRHAAATPDKAAIIWEGDEPGTGRTYTYAELQQAVCQAANALCALGLRKGERVIIYMGMVPEAAIAMLACARLGAVHSVVFGGFSAEALRDRVRDCDAEMVITQDEGRRGGRGVPLKATCDEALKGEVGVKKVVVFKHTGAEVGWDPARDVWWHETVHLAATEREAAPVEAEHPLFILYTSGSTGRPKGVVHTTAGYLTYVAYTHQIVFDLRPDDVYACVADVGWITGHSYIVYGPLANGATTLMFESTPMYPDVDRYWDLVARHRISIFYGAPTALRALAAHGDAPVRRHDRSSLRVLGTVGEPINPEAWDWYHQVVGDGRCTVVDTWWQTETGGIAISPIAPATPVKAGSATRPLPGIQPELLNAAGQVLRGPSEGYLVLAAPWPGQARTVWGDHARYVSTYFSAYEGKYFTGDGCRRDADGDHWITGRVDDVINVAGHRLGTAEFESALVVHEKVAEAAVVGYPHPLKGQGVYAYVVPQPGETLDETTFVELNAIVRQRIGSIAKVDGFQAVPALPKTRSGKVMRRILRKVAEGRADELGDTSTLADADVVTEIVKGYRPV